MKIYKSINNNIVTALDSDGMEVIVVGKGIGYHAKEGTELNPASIQKVYRMENQKDTDRLKALFSSLPPVYIEVTDEIFCYAKRVLNKRLNERAYISLADHIHFAAQRHRDGLDFSNPLLNEIRRFYSVEYQIGLYALEIIRKRLNITFPCDEAASIAIHILDAEYDISVKGTFDAAKLMNGILDIVENKEHFKIHDGDYYHERFLTHLKFLTLRIVKNQPFNKKGISAICGYAFSLQKCSNNLFDLFHAFFNFSEIRHCGDSAFFRCSEATRCVCKVEDFIPFVSAYLADFIQRLSLQFP